MHPSYPIVCTRKGCARLAGYKIAARWSDGVTEELKTYALVCAECCPTVYQESCAKNAACRLARGETLEKPGVYLLARGQRDQQLVRAPEMETE